MRVRTKKESVALLSNTMCIRDLDTLNWVLYWFGFRLKPILGNCWARNTKDPRATQYHLVCSFFKTTILLLFWNDYLKPENQIPSDIG